MENYQIYVLITGFVLPSNINITIETADETIKHHIRQISPLEPQSIIAATLKLKEEIPILKEKLEKSEESFLNKLTEEYAGRHPLSLLSIEFVSSKQEFDKETTKRILEDRVQQYIAAIGLLLSSPGVIVWIIIYDENETKFELKMPLRGYNVSAQRIAIEKKDMPHLIEKLFHKLFKLQRTDKKISLALRVYQIALNWTDQSERIIWYWMILEILAGGIGTKKVLNFVSKHKPEITNKEISDYHEMRSTVMHSFSLKEGFDYSEKNKNLRILVEELIEFYVNDQ